MGFTRVLVYETGMITVERLVAACSPKKSNIAIEHGPAGYD